MLRKILLIIILVILILTAISAGAIFYAKNKFASYLDTDISWQSARTLVKVWSLAAGWQRERTYLIILQNNDELRPTGGFIGTFAIVKIANSKIKDLQVSDSYALDREAENYLEIEPPAPIKEYLADYWWFRDANWSPDFPTTAEKIIWFYQQAGGKEKIDGVITVDQNFISQLLAITGSITVAGIEFNSRNFTEQLQKEVEIDYREKGIEKKDRKKIIYSLALELKSKIFHLPFSSWPALLTLTKKGLTEKHLLLFDRNPYLQNIYEENNWAGKIIKTKGDYLMVVDANMAALKTDRVVEKKITYLLKANQQGKLIAIVILQYTNKGEYDYRTSRWRSYTRIYVPAGSKLLASAGAMSNDRGDSPEAPGDVAVGQELDKTVFGAFWYINPGQTRSLIFEYELPFSRQNLNTLFVQKQPGTTGHELVVDVELDDLEKLIKTNLRVDREINFNTN